MSKFTIPFFLLSLVVARAQFIPVPNGSFESPSTTFASPSMDSWLKTPQPAWWTTNDGAWTNLMGEFLNTPAGQPDHLNNVTGPQAGYIFSDQGAGIFQNLSATYQVGKSYTMTVGLTTSAEEPLTPGATLQLSLYYVDVTNGLDAVALTTVTYDTNVFTNTLNLLNFSVSSPTVQATDPWAGKLIGMEIAATTSFDLAGGVWDLDNVQLAELPAIFSPTVTNNQPTFTIVSFPGQVFDILASPDLNSPPANWTAIASITNSTGTTNFTDGAPVQGQRFYILQQAQ